MCVPSFGPSQQDHEILLLVREVDPQHAFAGELGFEVADLDDEAFALEFVLGTEGFKLLGVSVRSIITPPKI